MKIGLVIDVFIVSSRTEMSREALAKHDESPNHSKDSKDADVLSNVIEVVRANPGLNKTEVCDGVGGNKSSARDAIRRAIESGSIRTEDGAKGSQLHYYNEATPF